MPNHIGLSKFIVQTKFKKLIIPVISFVKMNFSGCWGNFPGGCYGDRQKVHYRGDACVMSCWQWPSLDVRRSCHRLIARLWSPCWPAVEEAFCFPVSTKGEVLIFNALSISYDKVQACSQLQQSCQAMEVLTMPLKVSMFQRCSLSTLQNKQQERDHESRLTGSVLF